MGSWVNVSESWYYYAALRARLERGLLFGRRRRDKRDQ